MNSGIYTSYKSNNDFLVSKVAKLYLSSENRIADITFGKGVFWKQINLSDYKIVSSDLLTKADVKCDFKQTPYRDKFFDVVVFDPPYAHNPGKMIVNPAFKNSETTKGFYHKDIINLYEQGMIEAHRILVKGGFLWIKCQDEIETSKQRYSHIEIFNIANDMGFYAKDLFVVTRLSDPVIQHKKQKHARKNHSYLWIFQKK